MILNIYTRQNKSTTLFILIIFKQLSIFRGVSDCYDLLMNFSTPVLICDANEEFRVLLKEMMTKNGYFYVLEAASREEIKKFLSVVDNKFVIIEMRMIDEEISTLLNAHQKYLVLADKEDNQIISKSVVLGAEHFLNYPIHSQKLISKMTALY